MFYTTDIISARINIIDFTVFPQITNRNPIVEHLSKHHNVHPYLYTCWTALHCSTQHDPGIGLILQFHSCLPQSNRVWYIF
jgi:hypothetical protein